MNKINIPLLTSEDIEVKVKQVTKAGALALLYKTARVDRRILNEVFGPLNWTSDYKVVKDNLYCGIGIRESVDQPFVFKWDCGIESHEDGEGNEKKGEASDAFKRAGFAVGIGEELYTAPFIWLSVNTVQRSDGKYELEDKYAKYVVTHIAYNEKTRVITELDIANAKTNAKVFSWRMPMEGAVAAKMVKTSKKEFTPKEVTAEPKKAVAKAVVTETEKAPLKTLITNIGKIVKQMHTKDGNIAAYNKVIAEVTGDDKFKCNTATEEQYDVVLRIYETLVSKGYSI